jgi:hypothetical protein
MLDIVSLSLNEGCEIAPAKDGTPLATLVWGEILAGEVLIFCLISRP